MIRGGCHCGTVTIAVEAAPDTVTSCTCSICRRYGTLWAYDVPSAVRVSGAIDINMWGDRDLEFHRCPACGCAPRWSAVDRSRDRMGVNARMMPREVFESAQMRCGEGPGRPARRSASGARRHVRKRMRPADVRGRVPARWAKDLEGPAQCARLGARRLLS